MSADNGQFWSPPQELRFPIPRPIKGTEVIAARYIRILGGILIFAGGVALFARLLFGLPWAPGTTIGTRWEQIVASPSFAPITISLLAYEAALLAWLVCLFWFRKTEWLLRWGKPACAVVIGIRKIRVPTRCDPDFTITFQFNDNTGKPVQGMMPDRIHLNETLAGVTSSHFSMNQVLTVLYDPAKPTKYLLYPSPGYEIGEPVKS